MANESRPLYKAVCASCGKQCEVPFQPSGDRPVYCRDCFRARTPATNEFVAGRGEGGTPKQGGAPKAPFVSRPSSQSTPRPSDGLAAQVSAMNAKLDRLLALAESTPSRPPRASKPAGKKAASKKKAFSRKK